MTSRLTRYTEVFQIAALHVARRTIRGGETIVGGAVMMLLSPGQVRQRMRRDRTRPGRGRQWFTTEEAALVEALANLIVPSDETTPGAAEMDVLGRSAVEALDELVAGCADRQTVYTRGLLALDRLALDTHGHRFVDVSDEDQIRLLERLDQQQQAWFAPMPIPARAKTKLLMLYHQRSGLSPAVELFPKLVADVLQVFYTNRVSWVWLGYDGPPMRARHVESVERYSSTTVGRPEGVLS
jgi:hypothetical protein